MEKLDGREFKGTRVTCVADVRVLLARSIYPRYIPVEFSLRSPLQIQDERPRERYRSRSPHGRRAYLPPDEYDHRAPRGYSPPHHGYRDRTPPPRHYYDSRGRYRSPPRRPPMDDYPPPRRPYPEDPYDRSAPRRAYEPDPYLNGHPRPYERPPSPRGRPRSPRGYYDPDRRGAYY